MWAISRDLNITTRCIYSDQQTLLRILLNLLQKHISLFKFLLDYKKKKLAKPFGENEKERLY
jgi:hypothetical protein